jgi:hypothetical protein
MVYIPPQESWNEEKTPIYFGSKEEIARVKSTF